MDKYNCSHNHTFDFILNIYKGDDLNEKIEKFITKNNFSEKRECIYLSEEIIKCVINMRNGLEILDKKYITCLSSRIFGYEEILYDNFNEEYINPTWCLIHVWR